MLFCCSACYLPPRDVWRNWNPVGVNCHSGLPPSPAAGPRVAHAQQADGIRRIGILVPASSTDMKFQIQVQAFEQELKKFGWLIGQNVQIETRWGTANDSEIRKSAAELVALKPDVILAHGGSTLGPLQQATHTIPIVFPVAGDPVAGGFVESLARPGGNITGFALFEYSIGAKWLELLKQIVPPLTRAAVLQQAGLPAVLGQIGAIQAAAPTMSGMKGLRSAKRSRVALPPVADRTRSRAIALDCQSERSGVTAAAVPTVQAMFDLSQYHYPWARRRRGRKEKRREKLWKPTMC
jgi:hypothetical protein